ncbi:MAG: hypothetical protein IT208_10355 [Chthonomonadales bacterium]|nr:hypothetical protein [Chthonomonadales bacterium]
MSPEAAGVDALQSPPRRSCGRCGCCLSCLVALVLLLVSAGLLVAPAPRPDIPIGARGAVAADRFRTAEQRIAGLERDAAEHRAHPFQVTVTEQEINAFLASDPRALQRMRSRRIDEAWVRLHDGRIDATAVRRARGLPVTVTATLVPVLVAHRDLSVSVRNVTVGRLGVPRSAARRIASLVTGLLESKVYHSPVYIAAVAVGEGAITVTGQTTAEGSAPGLPSGVPATIGPTPGAGDD